VQLANRVRARGKLELLGVLVVCLLFPARAEEVSPTKYLPSIREREHYSNIVCAATIVKTYSTGNVMQLEGEERSEWIAQARVDRVFKGVLGSQVVHFKYYGLGPRTSNYFGAPVADFHSGIRYVLFLRGQGSALIVTVPFYQTEIEVASQPPPFAESKPDLALARELVFGIESEPKTIGRMASHYFSWVEELIGKQSVPLVEPFLSSGDRLLRYDAAWWLSFREVNTKVTNELKNAMQDESLGASERSAARDRLRDMAEGKFVPIALGFAAVPRIGAAVAAASVSCFMVWTIRPNNQCR
jgi:hypothetical protein